MAAIDRLLDGGAAEFQAAEVSLPPLAPGFLIAIEGIDGAGKTTQARLLGEALTARGHGVVLTKEPTNGQFGRILRASAATGRLSPEEELEVFLKDRQEHVRELIQPALGAGKVVIVDRYYFSTAAYQGCRGFDPEELLRRNEVFAPEPDLLFLMDVDPEVGLGRVRSRGDEANHFEKAESLAKARAIFNGIQKPYKVVVDASQPVAEITARMVHEFTEAHARKGGAGRA